ncbi:putative EF-Hand 1, calcium-binding protein [Helianthus annuus]|nr:putative EF-Hand 1, calcium-binding protein [Helianthus annuus]
MSFPETTTRSEPESSSGVRFEVGGSSSGGMSEQQEHLLRAAEKMKVFEESDSDGDDDVDVRDVNILMSMVFDLKAKLETKFQSEFADKDDDLMNVAQRERIAEKRLTADAAREVGLNEYLVAAQKKKKKKKKKKKLPSKKPNNKQILIMKNQNVNPLDENFQPKDPTKTFDRYVMELGSSHYDKVGNKSGITSWMYDQDKKMWLVIRESGHREYHSKESQFESWKKIDLKNLLPAPYHDSDPNQHGRDWVFHSKLKREVKNDFPNMKYAKSFVKKNRGFRDPYTHRTIKTVIWPLIDKEKVIPAAPKFPKGVLKNFKFLA